MKNGKDKYRIPEGYFDDLKVKLHQIPDEQTHHKNPRLKWYYWASAAACFLIAVTIFSNNRFYKPAISNVSDQQIIAYLESDPEVLFNEAIYLDGINYSNFNIEIDEIDADELEEYLEENPEF